MTQITFILGPQISGKSHLAQLIRTATAKIIETDMSFPELKQNIRLYHRHSDLIIVSSEIKLEDIEPAENIRVITLTVFK